MSPRLTLCIVALMWALAPSAHAQPWRGVTLDPLQVIRPQLLSLALASYAQHEQANPLGRSIAIVDFARPSSEPRFHLLDLSSGAVQSFLVAHGRGSDPDHDAVASFFSDVIGSH